MGLDISLGFDVEFYYDELPNISRTFCAFMSRRNVVEEEPELDQIGRLVNVDIDFLYLMEEYKEEWMIEEELSFIDDEEEFKAEKDSILSKNQLIENNIHNVKNSLLLLIEGLRAIPDLVGKIQKTEYDTIGIEKYFFDFDIDTGDGYINNNLGQDLRNLLSIIDIAINKGAKTVYFIYQ